MRSISAIEQNREKMNDRLEDFVNIGIFHKLLDMAKTLFTQKSGRSSKFVKLYQAITKQGSSKYVKCV